MKKILFLGVLILCPVITLHSFTPVQQQFGPQSQLLPISQIEFAAPKDMVNILPGRPVAARDKYGNRTYFSPTGRAVLRISNDGKREFSLGAYSKETDEKGKVLRETTKSQGSKFVELKNEKGEIVGYQELGLGGRVVKEYDSEMNLTRSYHYNDYGKKVDYVVDELSQSRTVYDDKGRPVYDLDFEGNKMAVYEYDEDGRLEVKTDVYGNKTYFDNKGNMTATYDNRGNLLVKYEYQTTKEGHTQLVSVKDMLTNNVTHYKDGKQLNVTNAQGAVIRDYFWDGTKLIATYDRETQETTWYGINGKPLYTTHNDIKVKEWLYHEGRLVGFYDSRNKSVVIYQNEREDYILNGVLEAPTAKEVQGLYDKGVIKALKMGVKLTRENVVYKTLPTQVEKQNNEAINNNEQENSPELQKVLPEAAMIKSRNHNPIKSVLHPVTLQSPKQSSETNPVDKNPKEVKVKEVKEVGPEQINHNNNNNNIEKNKSEEHTTKIKNYKLKKHNLVDHKKKELKEKH